ncbi:MAG: agmatinase family protein [Acidobacteria bacterium]|nr:agmatinase family protein [Acidobacteriota bacterium]
MTENFDANAAALPDSGIFGLPSNLANSKVVLIPVPFEATTSYGSGAALGPRAILKASKQVDLYDYGTGQPYKLGIYMLEESEEIHDFNRKAKKLAAPIIEQGGSTLSPRLKFNLDKVNEYSSKVNRYVYDTTRDLLSKNKIVGVIGGDHATPFGAIEAHTEAYEGGFGILHIDAHADLREAYEGFSWSHASIMYNVINYLPRVTKLVQVGIRDFSEGELNIIKSSHGRIITYFDEVLMAHKFEGVPWARIVDGIIKDLPEQVYLSFDIDGLDPTLCPNTGTPVPGGLSFQEIIALLAGLVRSERKIIGFDLTEVAPSSDETNEWDGNVGARLLYKMIGYTLLSRSPQKLKRRKR